MHTSIVLFALTAAWEGESAQAAEPMWLTTYSQAQKVARKEDPPLAVFVGSGDAGYNGVIRQGTLTTGVRKLLKDGYVCVYLDADKPGCQKLIDALEITRGNGLVVSDRTGQL